MEVTPNSDSPRFDICQVTQKTLKELHKICQFIPYAEGFNSHGWVKYHVSDTTISKHEGMQLYKICRPFKQLTSAILPEMWCINLERRKDRKEKMESANIGLPINFYKAVDGKDLKLTDELDNLFRNNNHGYRKAVIGCALSHINLWKQLLESDQESYLIIEDDVEFADNFKEKYSHAMAQVEGKDWDYLYLGFTIYNNKKQLMQKELWNERFPSVKPFDDYFYGAGFFGYVISKSGVRKMMQYIEENGVNVPIDSIARLMPSVNRYMMFPHIIQTPYVGPFSNHKDTDIQTDFSTLK